MADTDEPDGLTPDQRHTAAAGDLTVLAVLMLIGSVAFSLVNRWIGTMNWLAVVLAVSSTLTWSLGLLRRSAPIAAIVKVGFGFGGLAAPVIAIVGLIIALVGPAWGWAVLAAAVGYFFFSVLGLEIIERAEETGVLPEL